MNLMDLPPQARELLSLCLTDPLAAAKRMRQTARQLLEAADELERKAEEASNSPLIPNEESLLSEIPRSEGGMGDVVRMKVIGPDGVVRQSVDTSRN